jgi:hypothetical protein
MRFVGLGGGIVTCMLLDARLAGSNSTEDDKLLRAIQIRSTTSFGGEVNPFNLPEHSLFEKLIVAHLVMKFPLLMEPEY